MRGILWFGHGYNSGADGRGLSPDIGLGTGNSASSQICDPTTGHQQICRENLGN
jgi:hypothetical protein